MSKLAPVERINSEFKSRYLLLFPYFGYSGTGALLGGTGVGGSQAAPLPHPKENLKIRIL